MKYFFIIIYFLFFYSYPTLGNGIIGKGLVCKDISKDKPKASSYRGYMFVSKSSYEWWDIDILDIDNDGKKFEFYKVFDSKSTHYDMSEDDLFLRTKSNNGSILYNLTLVINRYDLKLKHFYDKKLRGESMCEIYDNKNNFLKRLDDIAKYFKNENQKKLQKRKF